MPAYQDESIHHHVNDSNTNLNAGGNLVTAEIDVTMTDVSENLAPPNQHLAQLQSHGLHSSSSMQDSSYHHLQHARGTLINSPVSASPPTTNSAFHSSSPRSSSSHPTQPHLTPLGPIFPTMPLTASDVASVVTTPAQEFVPLFSPATSARFPLGIFSSDIENQVQRHNGGIDSDNSSNNVADRLQDQETENEQQYRAVLSAVTNIQLMAQQRMEAHSPDSPHRQAPLMAAPPMVLYPSQGSTTLASGNQQPLISATAQSLSSINTITTATATTPSITAAPSTVEEAEPEIQRRPTVFDRSRHSPYRQRTSFLDHSQESWEHLCWMQQQDQQRLIQGMNYDLVNNRHGLQPRAVEPLHTNASGIEDIYDLQHILVHHQREFEQSMQQVSPTSSRRHSAVNSSSSSSGSISSVSSLTEPTEQHPMSFFDHQPLLEQHQWRDRQHHLEHLQQPPTPPETDNDTRMEEIEDSQGEVYLVAFNSSTSAPESSRSSSLGQETPTTFESYPEINEDPVYSLRDGSSSLSVSASYFSPSAESTIVLSSPPPGRTTNSASMIQLEAARRGFHHQIQQQQRQQYPRYSRFHHYRDYHGQQQSQSINDVNPYRPFITGADTDQVQSDNAAGVGSLDWAHRQQWSEGSRGYSHQNSGPRSAPAIGGSSFSHRRGPHTLPSGSGSQIPIPSRHNSSLRSSVSSSFAGSSLSASGVESSSFSGPFSETVERAEVGGYEGLSIPRMARRGSVEHLQSMGTNDSADVAMDESTHSTASAATTPSVVYRAPLHPPPPLPTDEHTSGTQAASAPVEMGDWPEYVTDDPFPTGPPPPPLPWFRSREAQERAMNRDWDDPLTSRQTSDSYVHQNLPRPSQHRPRSQYHFQQQQQQNRDYQSQQLHQQRFLREEEDYRFASQQQQHRGQPHEELQQGRGDPRYQYGEIGRKNVMRLACRFCETTVCVRGMKAQLLANQQIGLYSTDEAPLSVELINSKYTPSDCGCHIRDTACLVCGNAIGYHIMQPCNQCLRAENNGHLWLFHPEYIVAQHRIDRRSSHQPDAVPVQDGEQGQPQIMKWRDLPEAENDFELLNMAAVAQDRKLCFPSATNDEDPNGEMRRGEEAEGVKREYTLICR